MSQLLEKLRHDHENLARLLDLLSAQLDDLYAGDESNFDLKIEMLDYIEHYAEQYHHPAEEKINEKIFRKEPLQQHKSLQEPTFLTATMRKSARAAITCQPARNSSSAWPGLCSTSRRSS